VRDGVDGGFEDAVEHLVAIAKGVKKQIASQR